MKTKNIALIVDDHAMTRKEFGELVGYYGFDVLFAANGQEAVDMCLSDQKVDVVFMDGNMPIMNGDTATRLIKKYCPKLIIVSITGNDIEKTYQEIGYDAYLRKPILSPALTHLFSLIASLLSRV
jgi:CheY-like chemotaxis protein